MSRRVGRIDQYGLNEGVEEDGTEEEEKYESRKALGGGGP
jgi:hypothetical protein